jgi:hypothetical protein
MVLIKKTLIEVILKGRLNVIEQEKIFSRNHYTILFNYFFYSSL